MHVTKRFVRTKEMKQSSSELRNEKEGSNACEGKQGLTGFYFQLN